jgi:hypothetical protein
VLIIIAIISGIAMDNQAYKKTFEEAKIPRTIWFYWEQGWQSAPYIVKKCYASWEKYNQTWNLIFISGDNIHEYLPDLAKVTSINKEFLARRKALYSDIVRVNLLNKYGGVWTDATCFCCQPLDQWLGEYCRNGFFAFRNIHKDRLFESWFIAASPNLRLMNEWTNEINTLIQRYSYRCYWHEYYRYNENAINSLPNHLGNKMILTFLLKIGNKLREVAGTLTSRRSKFNMIWTAKPVLELGYLRYFFICDVFIKIIFTDPECNQIWQAVPEFNVRKNNTRINELGHHGTINLPIPADMKEHVDNRKSPVYKLTYKTGILLPKDDLYQMNSYNYLLRSHGLDGA